jgi:hypothetical protein
VTLRVSLWLVLDIKKKEIKKKKKSCAQGVASTIPDYQKKEGIEGTYIRDCGESNAKRAGDCRLSLTLSFSFYNPGLVSHHRYAATICWSRI